MTDSAQPSTVSRRSFLGGVGVTAGGLVVASSPVFWQQAAKADVVPAQQVHLQFGADPAREVVVSWATPTSVSRPESSSARGTRGLRPYHRGADPRLH
jgi:phosphodiesterase/alkaline phosphatase D-like protein